MKRLEVEPRSPAWHEIRAESWTASQAAMLVARENAELLRDCAAAKGITLDIAPLLAVGIDTFFENTPWKVWAEKTGRIPRFAGNEHTARGTENEERVLLEFEKSSMLMVEREVTATSTPHPWLLASFDAMVPGSSDTTVSAPNGFPVEAKCPAFQSRKKLFESKKTGDLAIMGLPYYWCQVQHQILVSEAPYGYFVAAGVEVDPADGVEKVVFPITEKVPRDDDFLTAYLAIAKFYFDEYIFTYDEPPMLESDRELLSLLTEKAEFDKAIAEADHETAVELYLRTKREEEAATKRRKELEAMVLDAATKLREEGKDVVLLADRLEVTFSKGATVSWQKVAKQVAKDAGMTDIPPATIEACKGTEKESVKLKEVA
jgi:chorismate mutase